MSRTIVVFAYGEVCSLTESESPIFISFWRALKKFCPFVISLAICRFHLCSSYSSRNGSGSPGNSKPRLVQVSGGDPIAGLSVCRPHRHGRDSVLALPPLKMLGVLVIIGGFSSCLLSMNVRYVSSLSLIDWSCETLLLLLGALQFFHVPVHIGQSVLVSCMLPPWRCAAAIRFRFRITVHCRVVQHLYSETETYYRLPLNI